MCSPVIEISVSAVMSVFVSVFIPQRGVSSLTHIVCNRDGVTFRSHPKDAVDYFTSLQHSLQQSLGLELASARIQTMYRRRISYTPE